jgi:hypothetical protein
MSKTDELLTEILAVLVRMEERDARQVIEGELAWQKHRERWDQMIRERELAKAKAAGGKTN